MLDIGWTELVVIAVVAILVVGPKDLPRMLRGFGRTMGQLRRSANEFKRQFDDALREAEREADFEDTRKQVQSITRIDPLTGLKKSVEDDLGAANNGGGTDKGGKSGSAGKSRKEKPAGQAAEKAAPSAERPAGETGAAGAKQSEAEPAKAEPTEPPEARRDSDAA